MPITFLGQISEWNPSIKSINNHVKNIDRIIYFSSVDGEGEELDSLEIKNNLDFEKVLLTVYHTEIAFESDADYYVVGMDIPLLELIEIESQEHQIKLVFSRTCNINSTNETQKLELNFSSEKAKEEIYPNFKKLLNIRNAYHIELHESNECTLETN